MQQFTGCTYRVLLTCTCGFGKLLLFDLVLMTVNVEGCQFYLGAGQTLRFLGSTSSWFYVICHPIWLGLYGYFRNIRTCLFKVFYHVPSLKLLVLQLKMVSIHLLLIHMICLEPGYPSDLEGILLSLTSFLI